MLLPLRMSLCRESEALLSSPEAQAGEAALAERAYRSSLARGVHRASRTLAGGLLVSGQARWACWARWASASWAADPSGWHPLLAD